MSGVLSTCNTCGIYIDSISQITYARKQRLLGQKATIGISWSADNQIENTDYIYCNISMIWPIVAVGTLVGITNVPEYSGYPQLQPQPNN